jgi:DNA-binding SARP family transcriptional activator
MPPIELSLLGPFRARLSSGAPLGLPARKAQALLAYLAVRPGQVYAREKLAALLWGDAGEQQARQSLRHALSAIRKVVPRGSGLLAEGDSVMLSPAAVRVDVPLFERLVARGSAKAFAEAASLCRGDLLEGFVVKEEPFEDWLRAERLRLRELALDAFTGLLASQEKRGALDQAVQVAVRLLALDPSREDIHRRLMLLYARQGWRGAALRQYRICVDAVRRELSAEPETQTKQLYRKLLRQSGRSDRRPGRDAHLESFRDADAFDHHSEVRLVGRDAELAHLRQDLEEAARGCGRLVFVLGEAGIGKSRLVSELVRVAAPRRFQPLVGRCYQSEQILAFGPWVDALRTARITSDPEILVGLGAPWRAELARLLPEAGEPASPRPAGSHDFVRLFEAVSQLAEILSSRAPLLLILEDLHWADEMSLRLLAFLSRRIQGSRVLMVATAREEEVADSPALHRTLEELSRARIVERLALGPLSQVDTRSLVGSLAGAKRNSPQLGDRIWRASGGNPFMAVETIRALQEDAGAEASITLPLPRRVHEVIAGRLGRLSPPARQLAAVGAVIGREFDFILLQRGARFTRGRTAEAIEELVRRRIVRGVGERFDFSHDRIREVAYQEILAPRRKLLHDQVARALEALHATNREPHCGAIGVHYQEAEVWDRALAYLRQGGAHSFDRSASREATSFLQRALAALGHLPETRATLEQGIDLRFELRNSLYQLGELPRVLAYLREAEQLTHRLDDPRRLGWLALYMAAHLWLTGESEEAGGFAERSRAIGERLADLSLDVWSRYYLGLTCFASGQYGQAEHLLRTLAGQLEGGLARDRLGMSGFPSVLAHAWLARTLAEQGKFSEGVAHGREGVALGEELDHPYSLIFACWHLAHLESVRGNPAAAIAWAERGLSLSRKWEVTLLLPLVTWQLGYARALSGDARDALPLLDQALAAIQSMGMGAFLPIATLHRGEALGRAGHPREALESAERALALSREHGQRGVEAGALRLRGETLVCLDPSDLDAAEADHKRALALAEESHMPPLVGRCHVGLGRLYERVRKHQSAAKHLAYASTLLTDMGMEFWLDRQ